MIGRWFGRALVVTIAGSIGVTIAGVLIAGDLQGGRGFGQVQVSHLLLGLAAALLLGSGLFQLAVMGRALSRAEADVESEQASIAPVRRRTLDSVTMSAAEVVPVATVPPIDDPTPDFGDPPAWIAAQDAEMRDFLAANWNWDARLDLLKWLTEQPDCDAGVAAGIFWLSGPAEDFVPFGTDDPVRADDRLVLDLQGGIARRFLRGDFGRAECRFDEDWPFDRWLPALRAAHAAGRIDWDPAAVPTVSPGSREPGDGLGPAEHRTARLFIDAIVRG